MGLRDEIQKLGKSAIGSIGQSLSGWADGNAFDKASRGDASERSLGGSDQDTAQSNPVPIEKAKDDPKALLWDPHSIVEQLGYKDKPTNITYGTLKAITYRMPIIQAIIQTRINQVASFCVPQHDKYKIGFRVQLRDSEKEPTKIERDWMQQAETFMMRTGVTDNPRGRDSFETFVRKIMYDSLVFDQLCYEVVPNRKGQPAEWVAVDAATMRLADSASASFDEDDTQAVKYVQIYDGMIIAEFTQEEFCFGVRNPRTDIRLQGYGVSELEMMIPTITSLLYAWTFNQKFFSHGVAAKGILNFKGVVPETQLQNFRKQWYSQVSSVENAWRTPITNSEDLQYINMQASARDMEFNAWMDFQIKIACSLYNIDPIELNFKYGNVGQKGGLGESNNTEKITESRERGLRPLLRFLSQSINTNIIWPINESFEFKFVGLDALTKQDTIETNIKRVKTTMMIDELRAEDDLPPLPDGKGQVILDPTYLQNAMSIDGGEYEGEQGEAGEDDTESGTDEENSEEYEKLLQQYEDDDEEDEDDDNKSDAKKSLAKSWVVNL